MCTGNDEKLEWFKFGGESGTTLLSYKVQTTGLGKNNNHYHLTHFDTHINERFTIVFISELKHEQSASKCTVHNTGAV